MKGKVEHFCLNCGKTFFLDQDIDGLLEALIPEEPVVFIGALELKCPYCGSILVD